MLNTHKVTTYQNSPQSRSWLSLPQLVETWT